MDFAAGDPAERRGEPVRVGGERTPRCAQRMSRAKSGTAKVEIAGPLKLQANTVPLTRKELRV